MKAILIDPWEKSLATINLKSGSGPTVLRELYDLVGEDGLDFNVLKKGECIVVGDHSALQIPVWPHFQIEKHMYYGRAVILGYTKGGGECDTAFSVDDISQIITWYPGK